MNTILQVDNLVKCYGNVTAVDGISFGITTGTCFGLLGPNGAGKTTTIEIIEGIIQPTDGKIMYKGHAPGRRFKEEIGIQFQATALLNFLSVRESLEIFASLYQNPLPLNEVISICYLEDILEQRNDRISGGQKQRLLLAIALVNDPELLFLDEPTTGLDPQARRNLWDIVEKIKTQGKTIVLTTHYMEEAQKLCDEIIIVDKGKIILQGDPELLLKEYCGGVTVSLPKNGVSEQLQTIFSENAGLCKGQKIYETSRHIEFHTTDVNGCMKTLLEAGVDLSRITLRSRNLEDLFLEKTVYHQTQKSL
jgi:ABC-2 type transport system ATP-binding protein